MKSFLSIFFLCVSYTYCIGQTKNSNNMTYYKNNEPRDYSKMIYSLSVNSMDCEFVLSKLMMCWLLNRNKVLEEAPHSN